MENPLGSGLVSASLRAMRKRLSSPATAGDALAEFRGTRSSAPAPTPSISSSGLLDQIVGDAAPTAAPSGSPNIFLVAVEESGDRLGAALMRALRQRLGGAVAFTGVGGRAMAGEGLRSLHPIEGFAIIGISSVPKRLPRTVRHLRETLQALRRAPPDALVVIDSPGYNLWLARFAHRADPTLPIFDYVSPSVWAWRPGRAKSMRRYINHVLALLPFEPAAHRELGGPPCSYVGHPLVDEIAKLRPDREEARRRLADPPVIVVLPGSRRGEVERLAPVFGQAVARLRSQTGPFELVLPTVPELVSQVEAATQSWPVAPRIVVDSADKHAAFRIARAALAKSGTVTLELALAGVPMVAAYRVSSLDYAVGRLLVQVPSIILANLVLGENVVPEFIQDDCTAEKLGDALVPLIGDTIERRRQIEAFAKLDRIVEFDARTPAQRAADIVLAGLRSPAVPFAGPAATL